MKTIVSRTQDIFNCIIIILCYLLFRITCYPIISFGIICLLIFSLFNNFLSTISWIFIGVFIGLLFQISYKWWDKKFYNNYSIVSVKKTKPYVINNRIMLPKADIKTMFLNDLHAIKRDYNKPGSYLTTNTHKLFVYNLVEEFTGKQHDFGRDFKNADIGTKAIYESENKSIRVEVKFVKLKPNISKAINCFKNFSEIKKAAKKIQFYDIKITIM